MNELQLLGLRLNSSKDMTFENSELEISTIQKVRRMMNLLVQSSHNTRMDSETVHPSTGVCFRLHT